MTKTERFIGLAFIILTVILTVLYLRIDPIKINAKQTYQCYSQGLQEGAKLQSKAISDKLLEDAKDGTITLGEKKYQLIPPKK